MLICLVSACFATVMTMIISTHFTTLFRYVPYRGVLLFALVITPLLTILLDGWLGFFVLVCSTMVGLYTIKVGSAKHYLMGCLILNLIIFFV
jgi:TctA family transporter